MPGQVFVKIDFQNAFNTLRGNLILEAVAKYFPELLVFAQSTFGQASVLQFGDFVLQSAEGACATRWPSRAAILLPGIQITVGVSTIRTRPWIVRRRDSWWQYRVPYEWFHTTRSSRQTIWFRVESQLMWNHWSLGWYAITLHITRHKPARDQPCRSCFTGCTAVSWPQPRCNAGKLTPRVTTAVKTIGADAVTQQLVLAAKCVNGTTADVPSENSSV